MPRFLKSNKKIRTRPCGLVRSVGEETRLSPPRKSAPKLLFAELRRRSLVLGASENWCGKLNALSAPLTFDTSTGTPRRAFLARRLLVRHQGESDDHPFARIFAEVLPDIHAGSVQFVGCHLHLVCFCGRGNRKDEEKSPKDALHVVSPFGRPRSAKFRCKHGGK